MPVLARHATNPDKFEDTTLRADRRQRPLCDRQGRTRPQHRIQARSELLGPRARRSTAVFGISTRSASTSIATPIRISKPSPKASTTLRVEHDPSRWETAYNVPGGARRPHRQGSLHDRPAQGDFRLRVQHPAADLCRHPGARGDRAAVRLRMAQPQLLLRPLSALGELFRGLRAVGARPAGRRARARAARAVPRRGARRHHGRHLAAAGRPTAPAATATRCAARSRCCNAAGYELDGTMLRGARRGRRSRFEILVTTRDQERLALAFARDLKRAGITARVRIVDAVQYDGRRARLRFRHDRVSLGPIAVARQRAGVLLGLGRGRRRRHAATTWASKAPPSTP